MRKRVISVLIIMALISVTFIVGYKFATISYNQVNTAHGYAEIARWSFGSDTSGKVINLSNEKIYPGSNGSFEIEVDASGSYVEVEYEIIVTEEKNIPTNMKFFAETINQQGGVIHKTKEYSKFTELAINELSGVIPVEENNQKRKIKVYWNWEYIQDDKSLQDKLDATLSYDENGMSSLECGFNIEIIGKQKNK